MIKVIYKVREEMDLFCVEWILNEPNFVQCTLVQLFVILPFVLFHLNCLVSVIRNTQLEEGDSHIIKQLRCFGNREIFKMRITQRGSQKIWGIICACRQTTSSFPWIFRRIRDFVLNLLLNELWFWVQVWFTMFWGRFDCSSLEFTKIRNRIKF